MEKENQKNKLDKLVNWIKSLKKHTKYQIGIVFGILVFGILTIFITRPEFFLGMLGQNPSQEEINAEVQTQITELSEQRNNLDAFSVPSVATLELPTTIRTNINQLKENLRSISDIQVNQDSIENSIPNRLNQIDAISNEISQNISEAEKLLEVIQVRVNSRINSQIGSRLNEIQNELNSKLVYNELKNPSYSILSQPNGLLNTTESIENIFFDQNELQAFGRVVQENQFEEEQNGIIILNSEVDFEFTNYDTSILLIEDIIVVADIQKARDLSQELEQMRVFLEDIKNETVRDLKEIIIDDINSIPSDELAEDAKTYINSNFRYEKLTDLESEAFNLVNFLNSSLEPALNSITQKTQTIRSILEIEPGDPIDPQPDPQDDEDFQDLAIDLEFRPTRPETDEQVRFTVEIENNGTLDYETNNELEISLINRDNNRVLEKKDLNGLDLNEGRKTEVELRHSFDEEDNYRLRVLLEGPLDEKTISNNSLDFNLRVEDEDNSNTSEDLLDDFNNARSLSSAKEALERIITTENYDELTTSKQKNVVEILRDKANRDPYDSLSDLIKDFIKAVEDVIDGRDRNDSDWPPSKVFKSEIINYRNKPQPDLSRFCDQNKILTEWWGPAMKTQIQRGIIQGYEINGCLNGAGEVKLTAEQVILALARYSEDYEDFECENPDQIKGSYSPWAEKSICYALENTEIFEKTRWNQGVTRVYTLRLVLEIAGIDILREGELRSLPFNDLSDLSNIYLKAIDLGLDYEVMFGQNNSNKFTPHKVLNRAEFVTILNRVFP